MLEGIGRAGSEVVRQVLYYIGDLLDMHGILKSTGILNQQQWTDVQTKMQEQIHIILYAQSHWAAPDPRQNQEMDSPQAK